LNDELLEFYSESRRRFREVQNAMISHWPESRCLIGLWQPSVHWHRVAFQGFALYALWISSLIL
jgi:hypothetical protein